MSQQKPQARGQRECKDRWRALHAGSGERTRSLRCQGRYNIVVPKALIRSIRGGEAGGLRSTVRASLKDLDEARADITLRSPSGSSQALNGLRHPLPGLSFRGGIVGTTASKSGSKTLLLRRAGDPQSGPNSIATASLPVPRTDRAPLPSPPVSAAGPAASWPHLEPLFTRSCSHALCTQACSC